MTSLEMELLELYFEWHLKFFAYNVNILVKFYMWISK